jgi:hypothetical protein
MAAYVSRTARIVATLAAAILLVLSGVTWIGGLPDPEVAYADDGDNDNSDGNQGDNENNDDEDRPNLKLEHVRLFTNPAGQVSDRAVSFKVSNIGDVDAPKSTGKLEILSPAPTKEEGLQIDPLDKGDSFEGFVQLPAACNGHIVRVSVSAPGETDLDDNTIGPLKLCPGLAEQTGSDITRLPTDLVVTGNGPGSVETEGGTPPLIVVVVEHLLPGEHTYPPDGFEPSDAKSVVRTRATAGLLGPPRDGRMVGWYQEEISSIPVDQYIVQVAQTAVTFDLDALDKIPRKFIISATITYDETAADWTDGEGNPQLKAGCVEVLGIATVDWYNQPVDALFPNDAYHEVYNLPPPSGPVRQWDVTSHVRQQVQNPDDPSLRRGYVLRGAIEDPQGDDNTSCLSTVSNIRLRVRYSIPSN